MNEWGRFRWLRLGVDVDDFPLLESEIENGFEDGIVTAAAGLFRSVTRNIGADLSISLVCCCMG